MTFSKIISNSIQNARALTVHLRLERGVVSDERMLPVYQKLKLLRWFQALTSVFSISRIIYFFCTIFIVSKVYIFPSQFFLEILDGLTVLVYYVSVLFVFRLRDFSQYEPNRVSEEANKNTELFKFELSNETIEDKLKEKKIIIIQNPVHYKNDKKLLNHSICLE
jgi:hypothetical protein